VWQGPVAAFLLFWSVAEVGVPGHGYFGDYYQTRKKLQTREHIVIECQTCEEHQNIINEGATLFGTCRKKKFGIVMSRHCEPPCKAGRRPYGPGPGPAVFLVGHGLGQIRDTTSTRPQF